MQRPPDNLAAGGKSGVLGQAAFFGETRPSLFILR
jgi:hypothetical protein